MVTRRLVWLEYTTYLEPRYTESQINMKVSNNMSNPNFAPILDQQSSTVERPKPLPVGTYVCVVKGFPRYDKSSKKGTDFVEFTLQPLQAAEDVDQEALEEMGGFTNRTIRATYYITEDAKWRLKKFLNDCGIEEDDLTLRQRIDLSPGRQVLAAIKHQPSDDGESVYAQLSMTAPVE